MLEATTRSSAERSAATDATGAGSPASSWILAWLAFLPVVVLRAGTLAEADTFWEIRAGLLTIGHRALPAVDSFSWTVHGKPWMLNSWGFNVLIAAAYRAAGLPGVAWECAGLTMVIGGLVLLLARQLGASAFVGGLVLLVGSPLVTGWLSARPQLADYAAVLVLAILMRRIAAGGNPVWPVVAAGIVSVVWVNLHAGELIGVAMIGACAAALLVVRRDLRAGGWCLAAGALALAGSLLNPYGTGIFRQAEEVQNASSGVMAEWTHLDPANPMQLVAFAVGLAALVLAVRRGDLIFTGQLGVAAAGSVYAIRFLPFLVLLALPVLAASVSRPPVLRYLRSRRVVLYLGLAAGTVVALPSLGHIGRPAPADYPVKVVADIPPHCRLFNTDTLGGFVILERPDVPVSLDTRNDLYGRQRVFAEEQTLSGEGAVTSGLAGADCVLVPPASGLAKWLRTSQEWELTDANSAADLFVRAGYSRR